MRERLAIFLVSAALIGFQLAIINMLSYSQWHHFAYLAVSIAMLGFGSSGVLLALKANFFRRVAEKVLPWLFVASGLLIVISPTLINLSCFRFDTFLLFSSSSHVIKLLATCFILFLPFFTGAMVIGLYFMIRNQSIPLLYAWNLAGSALGGVVLVLISYWLFPVKVAAVFGLLSIFGGFAVCSNRYQKIIIVFFLIAAGFATYFQLRLPFASQYKSLSRTLLMPNTKVVRAVPSPHGVVEMVESESLRQAQGMSLNYNGPLPLVDLAFLNGDVYHAFQKEFPDSNYYSQNLFALPYLFSDSANSLILQPGSTFFPLQAMSLASGSIAIVEPINAISEWLKIYPWKISQPEVLNLYPREYLNRSSSNWGIVHLPTIGSFGGSSGLSAMQEQYLFTTDALGLAMDKLTCEGMLTLSSYMDSPPRYSLKIILLVAEVLKSKSIDVSGSILAIRNWSMMMVLVKPSGFLEDEISIALSFCERNGFDMVHPIVAHELNVLTDSTFTIITSDLIKTGLGDYAQEYPFNIKPPTDNSPFFSQFLKISRIREYIRWIGSGLPFLELGYLIVWVSLAACIILALVAIAIPVLFAIRGGKAEIHLWLYFAFIGLAYMLIEISLIQKTILVVGNPVTASALIISSILCFSAIGSYYSSRLSFAGSIRYVLVGIGTLILMLVLVSQSFFSGLTSLPMWMGVLVLVLAVSPLSVFMGMAFPLAMKQISAKSPQQIPVVWGVNGFFSVIAAPIGAIVAVEAGFNQVLVLSAIFYLLCLPIAFIISKKY